MVQPPTKFAPRKHCLLFFNLSELEEGTPADKLEYDTKCLCHTLQLLLTSSDDPVAVKQLFRLGSKGSSDARPRPLKVIFPNDAIPTMLLRRGYRLKDSGISMRADLSPEDRERLKIVTQELRQRTANGEKDLIIVNFRVVRRRKLLAHPLLVSAPPPV